MKIVSAKKDGHIENTIALTFRYIHCLRMYSEVAWLLVSSGSQVQPQVILDPIYLPDYLCISYDYGWTSYI